MKTSILQYQRFFKNEIILKKNLNITIILKPGTVKEFHNLLPVFTSWLQRRKKNVQFLESEFTRLKKIFKNLDKKNFKFIDEEMIEKQSDLIISLGGDGTLIGLSRTKIKNTPIFGVNLGHLGFITEFTKKDFYDELTKYFDDQLTTFKVNLFSATIYQNNKKVFKNYFLNDAIINKPDISRMVSITVDTQEEHLYELKGDGLIVSSPTGSTAYSLAAGGPIVHPGVRGMILSPISPHSLTHRAMVVPDEEEIHIKCGAGQDGLMLTLDGQLPYSLAQGQSLVVKRERARYLTLVNSDHRSFFGTLKEKFFHGKRHH